MPPRLGKAPPAETAIAVLWMCYGERKWGVRTRMAPGTRAEGERKPPQRPIRPMARPPTPPECQCAEGGRTAPCRPHGPHCRPQAAGCAVGPSFTAAAHASGVTWFGG